jgi:hypothetical protein
MSWMRVGISFVVCAALWGLVYIDQQRAVSQQLVKLASAAFIPVQLFPEELEGIEIDNRIEPRRELALIELQLHRDAAGNPINWTLEKPYQRPANNDRVNFAFLQNLWGAKRSNIYNGKPSPGNGLSSPTLVISFHHTNKEVPSPLVYEIGDPSTFTGNYFARSNDMPGKIFTISKVVYDKLLAPFTQYVDLRVMQLPPGQRLVRIELENRHGLTAITATPDGWQISGATTGRADVRVVEEFVQMLNDRNARVTLEPSPGLELKENTLRVAVSDGSTTRTLRVGQRLSRKQGLNTAAYVARRDGSDYVMLLGEQLVEEFQLPPQHWADRTLVAAAADTMTMLKIRQHDRALQLRRADATSPWTLLGRPNRTINQEKANRLAQLLGDLRSSGVVVASASEVDQARAMIFSPKKDTHFRITADDEEHELHVAINPAAGRIDVGYALRGGSPTIFEVPLVTARDLQVLPLELISDQLFSVIAPDADRIALTLNSEQLELNRDRSRLNPGWTCEVLPRESSDQLAKSVLALKSISTPEETFSDETTQQEALYALQFFDDEEVLIEELTVWPDPSDTKALQLPGKLQDGTEVLVARGDFSNMIRLIERGRELKSGNEGDTQ